MTRSDAVDFGDDALVGIWIGPSAMKRSVMKDAANEPGSKGLESARIDASVWESLVDKCPGVGVLQLEASVDGRSVRARVGKIPQAIHAALDCRGDSM